MALLTMTSGIVAAVKRYNDLNSGRKLAYDHEYSSEDSPTLKNPCLGSPISREQLIDISKKLNKNQAQCEETPYSLANLLQGSTTYVAPPKVKTEPTSEYKQLMARLRHEEEARSYKSMVSQPTLSSQSPFTIRGPAFDQNQAQNEEEEMTYADVNRQVTLIINILVTVVACSIAIWLIARSWSAPKRLALSMGGSGLIAVAEVVIYSGYIRRLDEAKGVEKKKTETKVITDTWVIRQKAKLA